MMNIVLLIVFINTIVTKLTQPDITTKVAISWRNEAHFPAVTICNLNQFKVRQ